MIKNTIKYIAISDIHLGHHRTKTEEIVTGLRKFFEHIKHGMILTLYSSLGICLTGFLLPLLMILLTVFYSCIGFSIFVKQKRLNLEF